MDYQFHSGGYDTGPGRLRARRPVTDHGSIMVEFMRCRRAKHRLQQMAEAERPSASYIVDMLPPIARPANPVDSIPAKQLHSSLNKIKHPVNVVKWTPEGRRLLTGSSSGEFTLWNGMGFNFETIMQAHDTAIRGAAWSNSGEFLISADQDGFVKYWQPNFNNVNVLRAHDSALRGLAFSPTDVKFATASDDASLKIWDFKSAAEEVVLNGHNWDVKAVDWHPTKGLLVSGSKDHQVKLWDPRNGKCLTTLHGHKNQITKTLFEPNRGQLLATAAQDQTARIFDLRMMRDILLLRGHEKNIMALTWHPVHPSLLSTGGGDGSLFHYLLDEPNSPEGAATSISPYDCPDPANASAQTIFPAHRVPYAHEFAIWSLDWHPLGHILASGSNDRVTRFWSRARPGDEDCFNDRYHIGETAAEAHGTWSRKTSKQQARHDEEQELEDEAEGIVDQTMPTHQSFDSGLPGMTLQFGNVTPAIPGMSAVAPSSLPQIGPPGLPNMDPSRIPDLSQLAKIFGGQMPQPGQFPPPPPPHFPGFQGSLPSQNMIFPNYHPPPSFQPGFPQDLNINPANASSSNGTSIRKRGPLPSQQDTLREEMKRNKFLNGR